ncbi:MAG: hypothetical protein KKE20_06795 [Nanoarchaeota archaeon]|nr:hypothetical protein [Nanoarchaeota archaeon]
MKNMQLTLGDDSIDSFIIKLKKLKDDHNTVLRIGGERGEPQLMIVHKNFKVPVKEKKE